jgi:alpha-mannosidase
MNVEGRLVGQTAFGTEELFDDARENVAHRFVAVKNGDKMRALMNTGVYGSHFEDGALYMSLWRGVSYCAHPIPDREIIPADRFIKKVDMGERNYSFRLGLIDGARVERETRKFTEKPIAVNAFPVTSDIRPRRGFNVSISDDCISAVTVKKADGREAMIFRLLNNTDRSRTSTLRVDDAEIELSFGKYEVKTVLLEGGELSESPEIII